MVEKEYWLGEPIPWKSGFVEACNNALGRTAVVTYGSDGVISGFDLTSGDLAKIREVNRRYDVLDSKEQSKLRNLTWTQLENEITARQNEINAVTNLAQAKTAMLNLLADEAKAWRIVLWLMKREMNELE